MVDLAGHLTAPVGTSAWDPGAAAAYRTRWSTLCLRLLSHGGAAVVPPASPDPYLEALLDGGLVALRSIPAPGWARSSGANSADLWIFGVAHTVATGYALDDGGLWRQHAWAVTGDGGERIMLETTSVRRLYFGIELSGSAALGFARANDPGTLDDVLATGYTLRTIHLWSALEGTPSTAARTS
ncbi:MAG TPA: hypothetical protein VMV41_00440 [Cellulomonadaceae bacterium]|nr:hypothetical protein [Cellulomonadaceae bacterium]